MPWLNRDGVVALPEPPARRPIRVLVLDDSLDDCTLTLQGLADRGRSVVSWRRVDRPADLGPALAESWDLILVDWRMPGWSGEEALRALLHYPAPVIVLSGLLPTEQEVQRASALGADAFVEKGHMDQLSGAVDRALMAAGGSRLERTAAEILAYPELAMGILDAAPSAILAVSMPEGLIRLANREAQMLSGYHRSELLGQRIELLVPETLRVLHVEHRQAYGREPRERPMASGRALSLRRKDGSEVLVDIKLAPLMTVEGLLTIAVVRRASPASS